MKVIAIGDTHGRSAWKQIAAKEIDTCDKFVFIGDYFDSWNISYERQMVNFQAILAFKKANPEKVVLLIGNHDFQYMSVSGRDEYSGFQEKHAGYIGEVLDEAYSEKLIDIAFSADNYLYTHAGVTQTWIHQYVQENFPADIVAEFINGLFERQPDAFMFYRKDITQQGEDIHQSPIWVRPKSMTDDAISNWKQVVGHTSFDMIGVLKNAHFIDCLGKVGEYLSIVDGKANIKTI